MWFCKAQARAFGPLSSGKADQLDFRRGLNVVYGCNEAGKSSWHAALTVALCGRRRGPGRTTDEAAFVKQHRPWSSGDDGPWAVALEMELDSGSRLRIDRDLHLNETTVSDPELGGRRLVDVESEITNDGSPDGALMVGLNRKTFAMAASVRQAKVIADLENPDALQGQLARAAAGSDDATAARALERIESFRKEYVGPLRKGGIRPLQKATEAGKSARDELTATRERHMEFLGDAEEADRLRKAAAEFESQDQLLRVAAEMLQAREIAAQRDDKIQTLDSLRNRAGDGEVLGLSDVVPLARAMSRVEALPDTQTTSLESAEVLKQRVEELSIELQGFPPAPEVGQVQQWVAPLRRLAAAGPVGASTNKSFDAVSRRWLPSTAVCVVGLLAAVVLGITAGFLIGLGTGIATGIATVLLSMRRRNPAKSERGDPRLPTEVQAALRRLDEVDLPHDAEEAVTTAAKRREDLGSLQVRRDKAASDLDQRRKFDIDDGQRRDGAWDELRDEAALHGVNAASEDDLLAQVRLVLEGHEAAQRARDDALEARGALQTALEGLSFDKWISLADSARQEAEDAQCEFESLGGLINDVGTAAEVRHRLEILSQDLPDARSAADTASGELNGVDASRVDIASAEAELEEAVAELERVRRLDETLNTTARFMQQAADNAHRVLAPQIEASMSALVSQVTDCRYRSVLVDPADLSVRLETASGEGRDARHVSRGTTEQVYLALRIVLAEVLSTGREKCPLLLDDPTVHADSDRKAAILECLLEVADDRQIILFS